MTLDKDLSGVVFNGVSIEVSGADTDANVETAIRSIPGVVSVLLDEPLPIPKVNITSTLDFDVKEKSKARAAKVFPRDKITLQIDKMQAAGWTGKGVKVAVVDKAIDKRHPALTVDYIWDNRQLGDIDDNPDPSCMSHATTCAGLIKSKPGPGGIETGTAPGVQLGNYILGGCKYGDTVQSILMASEQAVKDGTNILSISYAYGKNWKFLTDSSFFQRITEAGILVVVGASNSGNDGIFRGSEPCAAPGVLCVGMTRNSAVTTWEWRSPLIIDGKENATQLAWAQSRIDGGWSGNTLPVWSNIASNAGGWGGWGGDGCQELPADTPDLSKYVVLIRRNGCNEDDMIDRAAAAGAKYILIAELYEQFEDTFKPDIRRDHLNVTALATISGVQGIDMVKALKAGKKISVSLQNAQFTLKERSRRERGKDVGDIMDTGSQWGPSFDLGSTTDVSAPGTDLPILVPVGSVGGIYAIGAGTSFATPLIAGAAALLMEALGTKDPKIIANALINTAKPLKRRFSVNDDANNNGLDSVAHQGGGLGQVYDASGLSASIDTDILEFNDTLHRVERSFTITNRGSSPITYSLSNVVADTVYTFADNGENNPVGGQDIIQNQLYINGTGAALKFSSSTVTVSANGKATIKVSASDPPSVKRTRLPIFSGFIKLAGSNGKNLSVPYFGVAGDADRVPKIYKAYVRQSDVTVPEQEMIIDTYVGMGTRLLQYFLVDAKTGELVHDKPFSTQNGMGNTAYAFGWKGEVDGTKIPGGEYKIRLRSLRAFGKLGSTDPEDYVDYDTPAFSFKRS